ncbi:hypothetical protein SGLAM104S_01823 [Streptomyces glaucescens]
MPASGGVGGQRGSVARLTRRVEPAARGRGGSRGPVGVGLTRGRVPASGGVGGRRRPACWGLGRGGVLGGPAAYRFGRGRCAVGVRRGDGSAGTGRSRVVRSAAVSAGASAERGCAPVRAAAGRQVREAGRGRGGGGGVRGAWSGPAGGGGGARLVGAGRGGGPPVRGRLRGAGGGRGGGARGDGGVPRVPCSCAPPFPRARARLLAHGPPRLLVREPGRPHVARVPARPDRRPAGAPARGRSAVRARHFTGCPRRCGNQSTTAGHLPGTSPYPAVILSGRLRS